MILFLLSFCPLSFCTFLLRCVLRYVRTLHLRYRCQRYAHAVAVVRCRFIIITLRYLIVAIRSFIVVVVVFVIVPAVIVIFYVIFCQFYLLLPLPFMPLHSFYVIVIFSFPVTALSLPRCIELHYHLPRCCPLCPFDAPITTFCCLILPTFGVYWVRCYCRYFTPLPPPFTFAHYIYPVRCYSFTIPLPHDLLLLLPWLPFYLYVTLPCCGCDWLLRLLRIARYCRCWLFTDVIPCYLLPRYITLLIAPLRRCIILYVDYCHYVPLYRYHCHCVAGVALR